MNLLEFQMLKRSCSGVLFAALVLLLAAVARGEEATEIADETGSGRWRAGFRDPPVRFIRLKYEGRDWDDGMDDKSGADINFLKKFSKLSGGMPTAKRPESHPIRHLKRYPRRHAPPFVFMTGSGDIRVARRDVKILRQYLLNGGMLFADCGSQRWHHSFVHFTRMLFPGNPLRPIADDDPIFQLPFAFPNGPPPLWHHGGTRAMGIKHEGRWIVFYHPGDVNDAWKTGHSGLSPELAESAFHLGINIVYYAFMQQAEALSDRSVPKARVTTNTVVSELEPRGLNNTPIKEITDAAAPEEIPHSPEIDMEDLSEQIDNNDDKKLRVLPPFRSQ